MLAPPISAGVHFLRRQAFPRQPVPQDVEHRCGRLRQPQLPVSGNAVDARAADRSGLNGAPMRRMTEDQLIVGGSDPNFPSNAQGF